MSGWRALTGATDGAGRQAAPAGLVSGAATFALEFALPLGAPAVLFEWHGEGEAGPAALSVFFGPHEGVAVLVRQGTQAVRHRLPGPPGLPSAGVARLALTVEPGAGWRLSVAVPGSGRERQTRGRGALPLPAAALAPGAGTVHPAVLWAGLADGPQLPADRPWIGPATPLDTPTGPRAAAALGPGDIVTTLAGPRALVSAGRHLTPVSGALAPVRLRSPWFAEACDLIVAPLQPVALSGIAVDYLLGEETVLALAADLAGVAAARREPRPGAAEGIMLAVEDMAEPGSGLVVASGCALALTDGPGAGARLLEAWEVLPLRLHLGPGLRARAA